MKKLLAVLFALCISTAAHAAPPTPESIGKVLTLMQFDKILDAARVQVDSMMKNATMQALQGKTPSPEEQKILDNFKSKVLTITHSELTMEKLRPECIEIYSKNFTQEDVDGLIAFFQSSAGKAYISKMPGVMQSIIADMPKRLTPMVQEIQNAGKEMQQELSNLKQK